MKLRERVLAWAWSKTSRLADPNHEPPVPGWLIEYSLWIMSTILLAQWRDYAAYFVGAMVVTVIRMVEKERRGRGR